MKKMPVVKKFAEVMKIRQEENIEKLLGQTFIITAATIDDTKAFGEDSIAFVTVNGKIYQTFSKVLITQLKAIVSSLPVEVILQKTKRYYTFQ